MDIVVLLAKTGGNMSQVNVVDPSRLHGRRERASSQD
jgi:hypothetical protein